jgi:hypothetical protein
MSSVSVPIPALDPPWPDDLKIAVVTAQDAPSGWRRLAHEVAAATQPGGHSFPLAERPPGRGNAEDGRTARSLLREDGVYASLYQEQFDGGKVQWQCTGGDIMADCTVRHRQPQPA